MESFFEMGCQNCIREIIEIRSFGPSEIRKTNCLYVDFGLKSEDYQEEPVNPKRFMLQIARKYSGSEEEEAAPAQYPAWLAASSIFVLPDAMADWVRIVSRKPPNPRVECFQVEIKKNRIVGIRMAPQLPLRRKMWEVRYSRATPMDLFLRWPTSQI